MARETGRGSGRENAESTVSFRRPAQQGHGWLIRLSFQHFVPCVFLMSSTGKKTSAPGPRANAANEGKEFSSTSSRSVRGWSSRAF